MRLILHIGTHKTGTSALQECLRQNERRLVERGIYYARRPRSKNSNILAKSVAKGHRSEIEAFLYQSLDKAHAAGARAMLISAESFYAMTLFFHKFNGRAQESQEYWAYEAESVEILRRMLPPDTHTTVVVFFRRQDHFLESIYRELVKSNAVAMPIEQFRACMSEALDYWRHMQLWGSVFPDCAVYAYEEVSKNISEFFFREVLQLIDTGTFEGMDLHLNTRLSRDVLEYKRLLNGTNMSSVDRRMSKLVCVKLSRTLTDDGRFQQFLAPALRTELLREVDVGNSLLSARFGMKPFPVLSQETLKKWQPYPGLSVELVTRLDERHAHIRRSVRYQIERLALLARQLIQQRLPMFAWIMPVRRSRLSGYRQFSGKHGRL